MLGVVGAITFVSAISCLLVNGGVGIGIFHVSRDSKSTSIVFCLVVFYEAHAVCHALRQHGRLRVDRPCRLCLLRPAGDRVVSFFKVLHCQCHSHLREAGAIYLSVSITSAIS